MKIDERIEKLVRGWSQWSRAEQRRMDEIVGEVLHYARTGEGNRFIQSFFAKIIQPNI